MKHLQDSPPLVSIVTVCRNSSDTIRRALDSVLQQGYKNIDYIVVDGNSTDTTVNTLKAYEEKFRSVGIRFHWISEPDEGIYDAMNKGLRMVQGGIVGILNSDDYYESGAIEAVGKASCLYPEAGIFYGFLKAYFEGEEVLVYRYRYERYLLNRQSGIYSAAQHPTCFVRRNVYDKIGLFDTQFSIAADHDFLIRASLAGVKFHALDLVLSNFNSGGASERMSDFIRIKERYGVWQKNGLLSADEYARFKNYLRYNKVNDIKQRITRRLFRL